MTYLVNSFIHYQLPNHTSQMLNSLVLWLQLFPWISLKGKSSLTQLLSEGGGGHNFCQPLPDSPAVVWEQIYHLPRLIYWPEGYYHARLCWTCYIWVTANRLNTKHQIVKEYLLLSIFFQGICSFRWNVSFYCRFWWKPIKNKTVSISSEQLSLFISHLLMIQRGYWLTVLSSTRRG